MKPGSQSFEAGLSATTPANGKRVRTATQSPVACTSTSWSLARSAPDARGQRGRLGGGHHLGGVDQVVAQLHDLAHARTARRARPAPAMGSSAGRARSRRRRVAADHQRERALLGADRAAGQRCVEIAGAGGGDPLVLGPFDVGVDGRAVDDQLVRSERPGSRASSTSTTSGELGTHRMTTSLAAATPAGSPPSIAPSADGGVDRAAAAGGHGHLCGRRRAGCGSWAVPWPRGR